MPCPQGSELPGDVPMLSSFCGWSDDRGDVTVGCPLGGMGLNVEDGLGTKPDTDGNGVSGKGYIPGLLSCLSIKSISLVIRSIIAVVSYNSGNSRTSS